MKKRLVLLMVTGTMMATGLSTVSAQTISTSTPAAKAYDEAVKKEDKQDSFNALVEETSKINDDESKITQTVKVSGFNTKGKLDATVYTDFSEKDQSAAFKSTYKNGCYDDDSKSKTDENEMRDYINATVLKSLTSDYLSELNVEEQKDHSKIYSFKADDEAIQKYVDKYLYFVGFTTPDKESEEYSYKLTKLEGSVTTDKKGNVTDRKVNIDAKYTLGKDVSTVKTEYDIKYLSEKEMKDAEKSMDKKVKASRTASTKESKSTNKTSKGASKTANKTANTASKTANTASKTANTASKTANTASKTAKSSASVKTAKKAAKPVSTKAAVKKTAEKKVKSTASKPKTVPMQTGPATKSNGESYTVKGKVTNVGKGSLSIKTSFESLSFDTSDARIKKVDSIKVGDMVTVKYEIGGYIKYAISVVDKVSHDKTETAAKDTPKAAETQSTETLACEIQDFVPPAVEAPMVETPAVEVPVVETPAVETPVVEAPVVETPSQDEAPVVETPSQDEAPAPSEEAAAAPVEEAE